MHVEEVQTAETYQSQCDVQRLSMRLTFPDRRYFLADLSGVLVLGRAKGGNGAALGHRFLSFLLPRPFHGRCGIRGASTIPGRSGRS